MSRLRPFIVLLVVAMTGPVAGQTSSLFVRSAPAAAVEPELKRVDALAANVAAASFVAVGRAEPRKFAKYDLVTIIVRESVTNDASSSLETEKSYSKEGKISAMPRITLEDVLNMQVNQSDLTGREPEIGVEFDDEWEGEGTHKQRHSLTARITARIIDIRPNGNLVLEARKSIRTDSEAFSMVVTGTCRKQDITTDNTVMSTRMFDLAVTKEHSGELRRASRKGVLTRVFEMIFNF